MSESKREPQPITWQTLVALGMVCATVLAVVWLVVTSCA